MPIYVLLKGKKEEIGTIRYWKSGPHKKTEKGWIPVRKVGGRGRPGTKELSPKGMRDHLDSNLYRTGKRYHTHTKPENSDVVFQHLKGHDYKVSTPHGVHAERVTIRTKGEASKHFTKAKKGYKANVKERKKINSAFTKEVKALRGAINKMDHSAVSKLKKRITERFNSAVNDAHKKEMRKKFIRYINDKMQKRLASINKGILAQKKGEKPKIDFSKLSNLGKIPQNATSEQKTQIHKLDAKISDLKAILGQQMRAKPPKGVDTAVKKLNWRAKNKVKIDKQKEKVRKFEARAKKYVDEIHSTSQLETHTKKKNKPSTSEYTAGRFHESPESAHGKGQGDNPTINDLDIDMQNELYRDFTFHDEKHKDIGMNDWLESHGDKVITDKFYDRILSYSSFQGDPGSRAQERKEGVTSLSEKKQEQMAEAKEKQETKEKAKAEKAEVKERTQKENKQIRAMQTMMGKDDKELESFLRKKGLVKKPPKKLKKVKLKMPKTAKKASKPTKTAKKRSDKKGTKKQAVSA